MKIQNLLKEGQKKLKNSINDSYQLDSEILMSKILHKKREFILLNLEKEVDIQKSNIFINLVNQRSQGKPIAYLMGKKDFWKYEFNVSKDVLIPRPDTELIIEKVLELTKHKSKLNILDIGVGSGCILLSILKEKPYFNGTGVDLSKKCLDISKINALKLGIKNRVKFFKSDIDNFNYGKYDLIISNPPYINKSKLKYLDKNVVCFEPIMALDGGLDGLSEIRKVINKSSELIKNKGKLVLEIAFDQKNKVKKLLKDKGFYINGVFKDLAKNDRCIICTKI
jgi:release factor glutamine methyltransferase